MKNDSHLIRCDKSAVRNSHGANVCKTLPAGLMVLNKILFIPAAWHRRLAYKYKIDKEGCFQAERGTLEKLGLSRRKETPCIYRGYRLKLKRVLGLVSCPVDRNRVASWTQCASDVPSFNTESSTSQASLQP